ncbi:MAG: SHOCT domain-containing protein [Oscillospiraceae bacterium]|jgi:hypothetical protein|nr:SHOCT domain-containing protein [Oscillospiraceae bacterium]
MSKYLFTISGVDGQLYVNDEYVVIERKGIISFLTQGVKGKKEIPIQNINAVQVREATIWVNGFIQFYLPGFAKSSGGIFDMGEDENTVVFNRTNNETANSIKEFIQEKINLKMNTNVTNQFSVADELLKYKQLLDDGIITKEEFHIKRNQLLNM